MLIVPIPLEAPRHDETEIRVPVDQSAHVLGSREVVGVLRKQPDVRRIARREVVLVEEERSVGVLEGPRVHLFEAHLHVDLELRAADDGEREHRDRRRQDEDLPRRRQQVRGVVPPPKRVVAVRVFGQRLLEDYFQGDVVVVLGEALVFLVEGGFARRELRSFVVAVAGFFFSSSSSSGGGGGGGMSCATFVSHLRAKSASLVEGEERGKEGELRRIVNRDADGAEAAEGGDVWNSGGGAGEEGADVGDGGHGDGRPRRREGRDDASCRGVFDRVAVVDDATGVFVEGRRGARLVVAVVEGAGDDEAVVEADAEHEEDADGGARAEGEPRGETDADDGREGDAEDGAEAEGRPRLLWPPSIPQSDGGVDDDDERAKRTKVVS
mmetsp:Transcript_7911/g.25966  ORF Transcript_7911/g.25966 Transcript_7911/m.25966 type:complete len:382 (-) Transcript_7911:438-1583(-)